MDLPFDIVFQGFLFKISESKKHNNTIDVTLISKPYGYKGNVSDKLIYKLYYYLLLEGFVDSEVELD
jgi:hypothetical protein